MRILVVGNSLPIHPRSGAEMRLSQVVTALAQIGEVDLFSLISSRPPVGGNELGTLPVSRLHVAAKPSPKLSPVIRMKWMIGKELPTAFVGRDFSVAREEFRRWRRGRYDVVWFSHVESYMAISPASHDPAVVDMFDLEDHKIATWLDVLAADAHRLSKVQRLRHKSSLIQGRRNVRLWGRLQWSIASSVDAVVVVSELDRGRLGAANTCVIENGYEAQNPPLGREEVGSPPTVLLQGLLSYPPNADAAAFLVERVAPLVWARLPEVTIRLVGKANERVRRLADPPRVVVAGKVPFMAPELAEADVVAVPIRYGSGTRIKILEAFAHRIPVVSTTKGAEGIDALDRRHLLIADTPSEFADRCLELLTDPSLRSSLVEEGQRLFLERYQWSKIRERIALIASEVAAGRAAPTGAANT